MDADASVPVLVKVVEGLAVLLGLLVGEADGHVPHLCPHLVAHGLQEATGFGMFKLEAGKGREIEKGGGVS